MHIRAFMFQPLWSEKGMCVGEGGCGALCPDVDSWQKSAPQWQCHYNGVALWSCPEFCCQYFHLLPFFLTGSARRKLTCTICNRKCSSSLNLQEHRKVRLCSFLCCCWSIKTFWKTMSRGVGSVLQAHPTAPVKFKRPSEHAVRF